MLLKLDVFQYAMSLDLNLGYYYILLRKNPSNLCTIVLPYGKYWYKCLPMGFVNSPHIFQQKMNNLFHGFEFIRAYLYDLLVLTKGDWIDHVQKPELRLNKLKGEGLKCNIERSFFGKTEMEYLGHWVTCDGAKPTNNNI